LTRQFVCFVGVGISAMLLHWLARIILSMWLPFSIAVIIAYFFGIVIAYELNKKFVFFVQDVSARYFKNFALVNLAFLPIVWLMSISINVVLIDYGIDYHTEKISHGIAICIPPFLTFLIYKFKVFNNVSEL